MRDYLITAGSTATPIEIQTFENYARQVHDRMIAFLGSNTDDAACENQRAANRIAVATGLGLSGYRGTANVIVNATSENAFRGAMQNRGTPAQRALIR